MKCPSLPPSDFVVPSPKETTVNNILCMLPNMFYAYTTYLSLPFFSPYTWEYIIYMILPLPELSLLNTP